MKFKGTKGKWVGVENKGVFTEDDFIVFETGCGCCTLADLDKYDALLISKSPEMLEMLQRMYDYYSMQENITGSLRTFMIETNKLIKSATEI